MRYDQDAKELIFNLPKSFFRKGCPKPIKKASDLWQLPCAYNTVEWKNVNRRPLVESMKVWLNKLQ